jgi:hypothetical protein
MQGHIHGKFCSSMKFENMEVGATKSHQNHPSHGRDKQNQVPRRKSATIRHDEKLKRRNERFERKRANNSWRDPPISNSDPLTLTNQLQ